MDFSCIRPRRQAFKRLLDRTRQLRQSFVAHRGRPPCQRMGQLRQQLPLAWFGLDRACAGPQRRQALQQPLQPVVGLGQKNVE